MAVARHAAGARDGVLRPLPILIGLVTGAAVVAALNVERKTGAAILAGLLFLASTSVIGARRAFLIGFLTFIPLSADVNFGYRDNAGSVGGLIISAADMCLFALTAMWLFQLATSRPRVRVGLALLLPALAILSVGVLSLLGSDHLALGLFELFCLSKATLILLVLPQMLRDERDLKLALGVLLAGLVLQSALALTQARLGTSLGLEVLGENRNLVSQQLLTSKFNRTAGTLLHPNMLACYLNLLLFTGIAQLLVLRPTMRTVLTLLVSGLGVSALIVTLSRGGWIAFAAGYAVLSVLIYIHVPARRVLLVSLSLALLVAIGSAAVLPTVVHERLVANDFQSAHLRIPLTKIALKIIASAPVLGTGINSYPQIVPAFIINEAPELIPIWYDVDNMVVHNLLLLVTAEMGLLGLAAFLWLMGALLWMAWRIAGGGRGWLSAVGMGIASGMVAFLAAETVDASYRIGQTLVYLVYTWGAFMVAAEAVMLPGEPAAPDQTLQTAMK